MAQSRALSVGIPAENKEGVALLQDLGFTATPSSYRMVRGPRTAAGRPQNIFAIGGGAIG